MSSSLSFLRLVPLLIGLTTIKSSLGLIAGDRRYVNFWQRYGDNYNRALKVSSTPTQYDVVYNIYYGDDGNPANFWIESTGEEAFADAYSYYMWVEVEHEGVMTNCPLFWKGGPVSNRNAEVRCNQDKGDKFYIYTRELNEKIGYMRSGEKCNMFSDSSNGSNAAFGCGNSGDGIFVVDIQENPDEVEIAIWSANNDYAFQVANDPSSTDSRGGTYNALFEQYGSTDLFWVKNVVRQGEHKTTHFFGYDLDLYYIGITIDNVQCPLFKKETLSTYNPFLFMDVSYDAEFRCGETAVDQFYFDYTTNQIGFINDDDNTSCTLDVGSGDNAQFICIGTRDRMIWVGMD